MLRRFPEKMIPRNSEYFWWSSSPRQRVSSLAAGSLDSRIRGNDGRSEGLALWAGIAFVGNHLTTQLLPPEAA